MLDKLLGRPLATLEEEEEKIGVVAGIPILGLDALSSTAYGPEAALTVLLPLGLIGLRYIGPMIGAILCLLAILYFSYRQTLAAYPNGGGCYIVARENLGVRAGLLAAAALMLDYVLNVAVGISAGIGALVSALPTLHPHTLALCLATLALITLVNLRGMRESGWIFGVPTYLFAASLLFVLGWGVVKTVQDGHPGPIVAPPVLAPATVSAGSLWLLLRSFASGCTAMTGVEAVSNGVGAFRQPAVRNAQRTLTAIVVILALLLGGVTILCRSYSIGAMHQEQAGYQSVLSQIIEAVAGRGILYYLTIGSVLTVLALSANTSFAGFPRLCQMVSRDGYLPHMFGLLGRRLVYSVGILILSALAGLLLIGFGGITNRLIPLFAVGAFGAFTLSQAGMVMHWRRTGGKGASASLVINAVGALATTAALAIILVSKFTQGAWVTLLLIPGSLFLFVRIKRHYQYVTDQTACPGPLDVTALKTPLVVVPIEGWNLITQEALRFGMRLSSEVLAVHVDVHEDDSTTKALTALWPIEVERPARDAGLAIPRLEIVDSPYREVIRPLLKYVTKLEAGLPTDRLVAVIIPELIESHWYEELLHNHRAEALKAVLLLHGDSRIVVINIPWCLRCEEK